MGEVRADGVASVWPLIRVADWVGGVLAEMMRSVIFARGQLEWTDGELPEDSESPTSCREETRTDDPGIPTRLLYLVHPSLRSLIIRLHSQLNAFTHFVLSIDRPIVHPGADVSFVGMTDPGAMLAEPRATMLAKANVVDVLGKEGVDLTQWGRAIESLPHCKLLPLASALLS